MFGKKKMTTILDYESFKNDLKSIVKGAIKEVEDDKSFTSPINPSSVLTWSSDTDTSEPETVSCETCKCLIKKEDAYKVEGDVAYFCQQHKKPYTKRSLMVDGFNEIEMCYYKEVEVTEDGTPIGYKKIK